MAADLSFLTGTGGASRAYTPDARKSDGTLSTPTDTPRIEIMGPAVGALTDAATPDISANGASFSFVSLFKGMVANLLAIKNALAGVIRVGGSTARAFASFTRPANTTAYALGQLVANSVTAGSVVPIPLPVARVTGGTAAIPSLKLSKSSTGVTNASFRVHLYRNAPTASNGDGGAWLTTSSIYLGYADITMDKVFTDEASGTGVVKDTAGNPRTLLTDTAAGSQNIYALIEARGAYVPGSAETFTLTAEVAQD